MPFASYSSMDGANNAAGYRSSGGGMAVGIDRLWESGLTLGLDAGFSNRHSTMRHASKASAQVLGGFLGGHAAFKPDFWDGGYLMGMGRIGFENVDMEREVDFGLYNNRHRSSWTAFTTNLLAGGGKDWAWETPWGGLSAGPVTWFEYGLNARPSITEGGHGASALELDAATFHSLSSVVGAHLDLTYKLQSGTSLSGDVLLGWQHEWADRTVNTKATFKGYSAGFESSSKTPGRDSMLLHSSLRATHSNGFFAQVDVGTELFRSRFASCTGGISIGMEF